MFLLDKNYYYYVWFFTCAHIQIQLKRCEINNKDEDNSPKTPNDKNHQALSQKLRQQTPEEGRRTYQPKHCGNDNKDEDNGPKSLNDKNHQASS